MMNHKTPRDSPSFTLPFRMPGATRVCCSSRAGLMPFTSKSQDFGGYFFLGTPKSSILIGFSNINHQFWWVFPLFLETSKKVVIGRESTNLPQNALNIPPSWICLVGDFIIYYGLYHGKSHVFVNHHLGEYVFYFFQPGNRQI